MKSNKIAKTKAPNGRRICVRLIQEASDVVEKVRRDRGVKSTSRLINEAVISHFKSSLGKRVLIRPRIKKILERRGR